MTANLPMHGPDLPDRYAFVVGPADADPTDARRTWMFTATFERYPTAYERQACDYFRAVNRTADAVRVLVRWPR